MLFTSEGLFEPYFTREGTEWQFSSIQSTAGSTIMEYLANCAAFAREVFAQSQDTARTGEPSSVAAILGVLLRREFNYQSRCRVGHLLPQIANTIGPLVEANKPIQFFLSYNGGYHATTRPDYATPLGFGAAATELLLLYQIALLKRRLAAVYPPGMMFHIVLNNGVANYVNEIPIALTEAYGAQLQDMIVRLGGQDTVRVMLQSELGDFRERMRDAPIDVPDSLDPAAHKNIERFLGRPCTIGEACLRLARYAPAETQWWRQLREIIQAAHGIRLLQVASDAFLSFRPFPGGATRSQTGQIGFRIGNGRIVPVLITTTVMQSAEVQAAPVVWAEVFHASEKQSTRSTVEFA